VIDFDKKEYEFMWDLDNISYLFTKIWLVEGFLENDFIAVIDRDSWKLYLEKDSRRELSAEGLRLLESGLSKFERECASLSLKAKPFLKRVELKQLDDRELAKKFKSLVEFIGELSRAYFYTEVWCYDAVEEKLMEDKALGAKVHTMQELKWSLREIINEFVFSERCLKDAFIAEIQKRLKIDSDQYSPAELISLLKGKKVSIPDRRVVVLGKFNDWEDIVGDEAREIMKNLVSDVNDDVKELKGSIASKGVHTGKVVIMPFDPTFDFKAKAQKMKKGDVLVAVSTGPEMMDACRKAGAIVAEEGGVCSHAAIVSREFKIPCIIGAKIATRVLKDGDIVEVDAGKGVVKVLKRRSEARDK